MKSNNLLRRIVVFLLCMAMTLSYMPASFYAFAQDGEEAAAEPEKQAEQIVEEKKEDIKETAKTEEKVAEPEKKEESKSEEKLEAAEMQQLVKEESAAVNEAETAKNEAEEEKAAEEAAAEQEPVKPAVTLAKTIYVTYHFYQKNADGNYVEARSIKRSVTSGNSTTSITLATANTYVKNTKLSGDGNMVTEFTKTWKDAKGNAPVFPLTMSYEEAGGITEDGKNVDVNLYAEYVSHPASVNLTIRYSGIMSSTGAVADKESTSSVGWGNGSTIKLKKLESSTGVVKGNSMYANFTYNGRRYVYTGEWEAKDSNGNSFTVDSATSISIKAAAGGSEGTNYKLEKDLTLTFSPIYEITDLPGLDLNYIDNVSTGSGSWSNKDANGIRSAFTSLTHEFRDPSVKSPELSKHYIFLYWEDDDTEAQYAAGEKITITAGEGIKKVNLHAWWQPSVTVNYFVNGELVESKESFDEKIAAYGFEPEKLDGYNFTGWYAGSEKDAEKVAEGTEYEAPAITRDAVDQKVINLYAGFAEIKKDEPVVEQPEAPKTTPDKGKNTKTVAKVAEETTIVEDTVPTTAPTAEMVNIADDKTPLAQGTWALINLIAAIVTALGAMVAIFRRKEEEDEEDMYKAEDEDDSRSKKMFAAKAAGTLAGIAAVITFLLTEDMSLPMAMIDKWTVLMVIMLAVQIIAAAFNKKASEIDDEQEAAEEAAN